MSSPNSFRAVCLISAVFCVLTGSTAVNAGAQDLRLFFSLSTPGARANAMGRTFTGVADDATATVTNPAGLAQLIRPQVYAEVKSSFYEQVGFRPAKFAVSFLGASTPWSDGAVAFSYHEYFRINGDDGVPGATGQTYAGSIGVLVGERLRVGATAGLSRLHSGELSENALTLTGGVMFSPREDVSVGVSGGGSTDQDVAPARFGAGLGIRPSSRMLLAADAAGTFYGEARGSSFELHVGGEYVLFPGNPRVFVRSGFYTSSLDDDPFTSESTETVATFGVGLAGRRAQIDVAFLTRKEATVSAAFRF